MSIAIVTFLKYYIDAKVVPIASYIDAKIDPIMSQIKILIDYMMLHEGKIATLEERTKNL